ncbi:MAG: metallophosphoesterase [Actinomycetota bacterium]
MRSPLSPSPLQVWAVEDTSVQLTWGALPAGEVSARSGEARTVVDHQGGPGALDLAGLAPGTDHRIDVAWDGGRTSLAATTAPALPGAPLCRIATISDLHLGSDHWGASKLMRDRSGHHVPFPVRCATAAIDEAAAWGAELLVIKGDAAHHQAPEHFELVGQLVDRVPDLPVLLVPGNHEVNGHSGHPMPAKVGRRGAPYVRQAACVDLAGLRVIVGDTTIDGKGIGTLDRVADDIVELARVGNQPYFLGLHHQLQPRRLPDHYPPGLAAPASTGLLDALAAANPKGFVSSGHTHRNRWRRHGPLGVSEVASTRDWPGVWAGYVVHEGGIRQVVRRTAAPDAITWTEYSRRALLGLWGWWAAGPRDQRCVTHRWLPQP